MKITSLSNPHIRAATAVREKRSRQKPEAFVIEGVHLIEMAVASGAGIREVFFTQVFGSRKEGQSVLRLIRGKATKLFEVTEQIMKRLADTETPQGVVAVVTHPSPTLDKLPLKSEPLLVVVDDIRDPGNLGTIIRTSDAAGADAVIILPGTCDAFMPKTIRATAGSIFNIPLIYTEEGTLLRWLKARGITLAVTSVDAEKSFFDSDLGIPVALVFGNEAQGVSEALKRAADFSLRIPIYGKAESLNVATSAAICLYEAARQRKEKETIKSGSRTYSKSRTGFGIMD